MFQFTGFPSIRYGLAYGYMRSSHVGFPIRISPDQWIFAPPRSFSQLVTSFIGSQCLGIHPAPFMLDLLDELFTHLWPPFRHSVGFRVLPHELLPHPLSPLGCGCQIPSIRSCGRPSSGLFWFVRYFRNASDVFPISLRFTLGYRLLCMQFSRYVQTGADEKTELCGMLACLSRFVFSDIGV